MCNLIIDTWTTVVMSSMESREGRTLLLTTKRLRFWISTSNVSTRGSLIFTWSWTIVAATQPLFLHQHHRLHVTFENSGWGDTNSQIISKKYLKNIMKLGSSIPNYIVKSKNICFLNNGRDVCFDKKKIKKICIFTKKNRSLEGPCMGG